MDDWQPLPEGSSGSSDIVRYTHTPLPVAGASLLDLTKDYQLFTSAVTLTGLSGPSDPLCDFLGRRPDIEARIVVTRGALFQGIGTPAMPYWDHALLAVPHAQWPTVRDFLSACVIVDPVRQHTFRTKWLYTTVPDDLALQRAATIPQHPRAPAYVLGLVGHYWQHTLGVADATLGPAPILKDFLYADRVASPK